MSLDLDATIAAIASAPGGGLRGIVRISGPRCHQCLVDVFEPGAALPTAGPAICRQGEVRLPPPLGAIPARLYFWPTARSYTRQPSAELHLPGSPPVVDAVLRAVCQAGARLARPGEFTLRALLAGRIDLTQAEAVLGVIEARGQQELDTALRQLAGGLAGPLAALREQLLDLLAELEAGLDFADEDLQWISPAEVARRLADAGQCVAALHEQMQTRGQADHPPRVVLVGLPNVGKSSLLNALAARSAALVADIPGTTRDFVACTVEFGSRACLLVDTAGLLPADGDAVAAAAQQMTRQQAAEADLVLLCLDATLPLASQQPVLAIADESVPRLVVWTRCDRAAPGELPLELTAVATSSLTGQGLEVLRREVARRLAEQPAESAVVASTAERCRESLRLAAEALARAAQLAAAPPADEWIAGELRLALEELGRVAGAVYTDDVLDRIFSRFCIGK